MSTNNIIELIKVLNHLPNNKFWGVFPIMGYTFGSLIIMIFIIEPCYINSEEIVEAGVKHTGLDKRIVSFLFLCMVNILIINLWVRFW